MSMLWPDITTWPDITDWPGDDTPTPSPPTPLLRPEATVTLTVDGEPVEVDVTDGQITLDETWSPYVQAELTVPWTSVEVAETIDPQEDQRVTVEATEAVGGSTRTFDLGLRGRRIDHKGKRITLTLHSDEALLFDKRRLAATPDKTPRDYESSLRDICSWALGKIGATLEAGDDDADLTAYWEARNLIMNPNVRVNLDGWGSLVASSSTLIRNETAIVVDGATPGWRPRLRIDTTTAGRTSLRYGMDVDTNLRGIQAGRLYWQTGWVLQDSGSAKTGYVWAGFKDDNDKTIQGITETFPLPNDTPTRIAIPWVAPVGATTVALEWGVENGMPSGSNVTVIGAMFVESEEDPGAWWDGGRADDLGYEYEYEGDVGASASTRIPDVERPPRLFAWRPGISLWDFLQPLMEASGFRLFCDEDRVWRLVDLSTYSVPGQVVVQEKVNAIEGEDEITRNDDTWGTGVVCHYVWTDIDGIRREAYDYAGTDDKVVTVPYPDTPYPGPGAAAALLKMFTGRGRTQDTSRLIDYAATPGMSALITLPGTLPQAGKVSSVTFQLHEGVMDVGSSGLTEVTPGSWADVDADLEWDDTGTTDVDWKDWI